MSTIVMEGSQKTCLHCHQLIPKPHTSDFCCMGCQSVYSFIKDQNFDSYYKILEKLGNTADRAEILEGQDLNIFNDPKLIHIFNIKNNRYGFYVPDIKCAACIWLIEKIFEHEHGFENVDVNIFSKIVSFECEVPNLHTIAQKLNACGYKPFPLPFASSSEFNTQMQKQRLKDIAISGFAAGNIMLFSISIYYGNIFGIDETFRKLFDVLSMIIAIPAVIYGGRSFFKNSWNALKIKHIHVDTTISFALILSLCASVTSVFLGLNAIYFDSLTGLVFLLLIGRYIQDKSLFQNKALGDNIQSLLPQESFSIEIGQNINVPIGKIIPVDGIIVEGSTEINQASLTGEEIPVYKTVGDFVYAGSQNIVQPIVVKAEKTGHSTWMSSLQNLIQSALSKKSKIETMVNIWLPFFTLLIFAAAFGSIIYWTFHDTNKILPVFTSILVIACPCALALATPLTIAQALKTLWKHGVIVKDVTAIETLARVDAVVFDKTGTLTDNQLKVVSHNCDDEIKLKICALITQKSLHHVSVCIHHTFNDILFKWHILNVKEFPGLGIQAEVQGYKNPVKIGNAKFIKNIESKQNEFMHVYARFDDEVFTFNLSEKLNKNINVLTKYLNEHKINTCLFSGDVHASCARTADLVSINEKNVKSGLMPHEKYENLETLQKNHIVCAIGDGVNDAAMLAKAHVGFAVAGGVDVALHAADVFLRKKDMGLIKKTFEYAKYVRTTLFLLIIFNVIYNVSVIGCAFFGWVNPLFAAIAMPISSFVVYCLVVLRKGSHIWT